MFRSLQRRRSFENLVRAYTADLYRFAHWLCRDRFVAEDLVQDTFARAWNAWEDLRAPDAAKAWLFAILRREHARRFGRKQLELVADDLTDLDGDAYALPAPISMLDEALIREAIAHLPATLSEPLLLQVLGGFDCLEIARMLETTEGAVMTRVCRARAALRTELASAGPERREKKGEGQ